MPLPLNYGKRRGAYNPRADSPEKRRYARASGYTRVDDDDTVMAAELSFSAAAQSPVELARIRMFRKQADSEITAAQERDRRWNDDMLFNTETQEEDVLNSMNLAAENIQKWVNLALPEYLTWERIRPQDKEWFQTWAPRAEQYFGVTGDIGGTKNFLKAWIWRIIWEQLFDEADLKWSTVDWAAFGRVEKGFRDVNIHGRGPNILGEVSNIPGGGSKDLTQKLKWHKVSAHSYGKLLYTIHGPHACADRLRVKILAPFHHLILKDNDVDAKTHSAARDALDKILQHAIEVDFWHITSLHGIELTWQGTFSPSSTHGFRFREWHVDGNRRMEPIVRQDVKRLYDPEVLNGRPVDFIRCPTLTIHTHEVSWDENDPDALPTIVRQKGTHYEPLRVMVNNKL